MQFFNDNFLNSTEHGFREGRSDHNIVLADCKLKPSIIQNHKGKYISGQKQTGTQ